jgi:hypothetical protein
MVKTNMLKLSSLVAGLALGTMPFASFAGETMATGKQTKELVEQVKESCITGDLGVNVVSQYVSRGLIFENQGAIIQPYADLYFKLYEGDGFLNKIQLNLGIWNSFHSRKTDAGLASGTTSSSTRSWYEFDFTAGVSFTFAKYVTLTPSYYWFLSPNDGFSTFQGLNVKLALDDSEWLGAFALHPTIQVLFELENKAGNGPDEGIYYEVAIAPALPAFGPLTVSFPMVAGFGSNDFYTDDAEFGFFSAGVSAAYAMTFVPECFGTWTATAGATFYALGDPALDEFNPGVRDPGNEEWVFSGGVGLTF